MNIFRDTSVFRRKPSESLLGQCFYHSKLAILTLMSEELAPIVRQNVLLVDIQ